jgi:hypothetical protein
MSMTELERHLLNCLEEIQQEFTSSQKSQANRLANLEERQKEQERCLNQLETLFKKLELLLQPLNNILASG